MGRFCKVLAPLFEGAFQVIATVLGTVLDSLINICDIFSNLFQGNWSGAWEAVKSLFSTIWNVSNACTAIANSCSSILGGISNSAYSWGADICIEMASGINANAWRVTNAASNLANAVSNLVGFSIPKEGPLSDVDEYMPDFMTLMAEGIRKSSKKLIASVRELASSVGGAFTGLSLPEIGAGQLAMAGAGGGSVVNNTRSIGSLQVVVNGYNARNDSDLADTVVHRINEMLNVDSRVWGK